MVSALVSHNRFKVFWSHENVFKLSSHQDYRDACKRLTCAAASSVQHLLLYEKESFGGQRLPGDQ